MSTDFNFIVEASNSVGHGHLKRCITIAKNLPSTTSYSFTLLPSEETSKARILQELGMTPHLGINQIPDSAFHICDVRDQFKKIFSKLNPERCICFDYFDSSFRPRGVINLLDHSGKMKALYQEEANDFEYKEGNAFAIIRPEILELRPKCIVDKIDNSQRLKAFISIGGADPKHLTVDALNSLVDKIGSICSITVNIGPMFSEELRKKILRRSEDNSITLTQGHQYEMHLSDADLVITNGGTSLLEALVLGKPTTVFPQTQEEMSHAQQYVEASCCVVGIDNSWPFCSADQRVKYSTNALKQIDGKGLYRVTAYLLNLLKDM